MLLALVARAETRCGAADVRWADVDARITVSGDVTCTLTEVRALLPTAPLTLVEEGVWLLGADLFLEEGATLVLEGSAGGGDVDELRLRSDNHAGPDAFVEIRALWGSLRIAHTRVTSWDTAAGGPDTETDTYGRAFVRVLSFLDGDTPRVSRMDIEDSDVGYLGYYAPESYGLVWKVRGDAPDLYDRVDVLGDVTGSTIHHNYFGMYTFGAYGMRILGNEFADNVYYGVDPHDDSDALLVEGNAIHHNGNHGFICSKRCDGLIVRNNTSSSNGQAGFMFHAGVTGSVLEGNVAEHNGDAGFALVDSHDNEVRDNIARHNLDGLRLCTGASGNVLAGNLLTDNARYGVNLYVGSDPPTINDGRVQANVFTGNDASRNGDLGLRGSQAHANRFVENTFADNVTWEVALLDATDNVFVNDDLAGGWFIADGASVNEIADTDAAAVRLDDPRAAVTFTDSAGRVFEGDVGIDTRVDADGSSFTLTGADAATGLHVSARPLAVAPADGALTVRLVAWTPTRRAWSTAPSDATDALFVVGDLVADERHTVWRDGTPWRVLAADATGAVAFSAPVGDAPHRFAVRSGAARKPLAAR